MKIKVIKEISDLKKSLQDLESGIETTKTQNNNPEPKKAEKPTETKPKKDSGPNLDAKENKSCGCVNEEEVQLSVFQIQNYLANIYGTEAGGLQVTYSGRWGPGIAGQADGVCGPETRAIIARFQKENGIPGDSCVNKETLDAMKSKDRKHLEKVKKLPKSAYETSMATSTTNVTTSTPDLTSTSVSIPSGATISIKSKKVGSTPSRGIGPNYQGDASNNRTDDDAGIINAKDFRPEINASGGMRAQPGRGNRQFGHPVLLGVLLTCAAAMVKKFPNMKKEETAELWNVSKKHGGPMGKHKGHQTGLECDIGFYTKGKYKFDHYKNAYFLEQLLSQKEVELVIIDTAAIVNPIKKWLEKRNLQGEFPKIYSSSRTTNPALSPSTPGSHKDHYHVRCHFPPGSRSMADFERDEKLAQKKNYYPGAPIKLKVSKQSNNTRRIAASGRFKKLSSMSLDQIKKLYPNKTQFGYTFGTIDGNIIEQYNQDQLFTGASMPKTMAGLVQLVTYKDSPERQLNRYELEGLLTYWQRRYKKGIPGTKKWLKWKGSNEVQRGISSTYSGPDYRHRRKGLGIITPKNVREVSKVFGISARSGFLFGGGQNKQTTKDAFLFFAGLARMDQEKFNSQDDKLKAFYFENKKEVKRLIRSQKLRTYSRKMGPSGALDRTHWGKGGLWNGAVNFVFIIDNKYVLSVYTQARPRVPKGPKRYVINKEGYDLLNAVLSKLLEKTI